MRLLTITTFFFLTLVSKGQPIDPIDIIDERICNKESVFQIAEYMPFYNGTKSKLEIEINSLISFDKKDKKISGDLFIRLIINCDGEPIVVRVLRGPNNNINNKVFEAFKKSEELKNWTPAKQKGKQVDCIYNIVITINRGKVVLKVI